MKVRFDKVGYPLYCDAGPHDGDTRIDLAIRLYLSPQECASYDGPENLQITLSPGTDRCPPAGSTGEPSGELPAVEAPTDEDRLAARAGREPIRGGLNDARVNEHGPQPRAAMPPGASLPEGAKP